MSASIAQGTVNLQIPAWRFWLVCFAVAVFGGYAGAWVWTVCIGSYPVALVLIRAGIITAVFLSLSLCFWWLYCGRTITVRSLVIGAPLMAGLLAFPLPYYSQSVSVQQTLKKARVDYRVEADGFSKTLQKLASELFAFDSPNLFASELTYIRIDLAKTNQEQLLKLGNHPKLQVVDIVKSAANQHFNHETIEWINSLRKVAHITLSLYKVDEHDLERLKAIRRPVSEIHVFNKSISTAVLDDILMCPTECLYFYDVDFPNDFGSEELIPRVRPLNDVRLQYCRLTGSQLLKIAEHSGCTALNCDNLLTLFSLSDCEQLATLPRLESVLLGTTRLQFDQLRPFMASPTLKTFSAAAAPSISDEELQLLRASIPDGCNRRVRVDYGPGINVGSVPGRRGL